ALSTARTTWSRSVLRLFAAGWKRDSRQDRWRGKKRFGACRNSETSTGLASASASRATFCMKASPLMAEFILDASVAISWCFPGDPTEDTAYSRRILAELSVRDAIVPEVWAFEIANVIFVSFSKRKRINEQQIGEYRIACTHCPSS